MTPIASLKPLAVVTLAVITTGTLAAACGSDDSKPKNENKPGATPTPTPTATPVKKDPNDPTKPDDPTPPADEVFKATDYVPTVGDERVTTNKTKAWTSAATEPADWTDAGDMTRTIVATYKPGLACKARATSKVGTAAAFEMDYSCGELDKPLQCGTEAKCDEESTASAGKKDVGEWKGALGTKTTCRKVVENKVTGKFDLSFSETIIWQSNDILDTGRTVLVETSTCTIEGLAAKADGAKDKIADACKATGQTVKFAKTESTVKSQKKGTGAKVLELENKGSFKVSGTGIAAPTTTRKSVMCTYSAGTVVGGMTYGQGLTVMINENYCDADNKAQSRTLMLPTVPKAGYSATNLALGGLMFTVIKTPTPVSYGLQVAGDCKATVAVDKPKGGVTGSVDCGAKSLKDNVSPATAAITETTFSCLTPAEYLQ